MKNVVLFVSVLALVAVGCDESNVASPAPTPSASVAIDASVSDVVISDAPVVDSSDASSSDASSSDASSSDASASDAKADH